MLSRQQRGSSTGFEELTPSPIQAGVGLDGDGLVYTAAQRRECHGSVVLNEIVVSGNWSFVGPSLIVKVTSFDEASLVELSSDIDN